MQKRKAVQPTLHRLKVNRPIRKSAVDLLFATTTDEAESAGGHRDQCEG